MLVIRLIFFSVGMAMFPLVAIPLVFLFAHGTFCENDFSLDVMKRLDFLETSNLKMKSQLGVIEEGIILQSDELKEVSITFDKLQDQVQGLLPNTSFDNLIIENMINKTLGVFNTKMNLITETHEKDIKMIMDSLNNITSRLNMQGEYLSFINHFAGAL